MPGRVLGRARLGEGVVGITRFHELIGRFADPDAGPDQVVIGIETDRGPWVAALIAAGYVVYAVNPRRRPGTGSGTGPQEPRVMPGMARAGGHGAY